jgi:hypothetical protein
MHELLPKALRRLILLIGRQVILWSHLSTAGRLTPMAPRINNFDLDHGATKRDGQIIMRD